MAPWITETINGEVASANGTQVMEKNLVKTEMSDLEKRCTALRGYL